MVMSKKYIINSPDTVIQNFYSGFLSLHPFLTQHPHFPNVILRKDFDAHKTTKVSLLTGGGSGHEPAHAGYVGKGILTGCVAGSVFASPSVPSILAAIRAVTGPRGTLLLVKNYTGDRLNFGMACERAKSLGLKVSMVVIGDDCATGVPNKAQKHGKDPKKGRGIAGTVFIHKIAGAAAEEGKSLEEITEIAQNFVSRIDTLGVAWEECALIGKKETEKRISEGEMEIGLGIHGEPGIRKAPIKKSNEIARDLMEVLWNYRDREMDDLFVVMINNLGTVIPIELYIFADAVLQYLNLDKKIRIERLYVGNFMTALNMGGISVSLLSFPKNEKSKVLAWLDSPTGCVGWPPAHHFLSDLQQPKIDQFPQEIQTTKNEIWLKKQHQFLEFQFIKKFLTFACENIISNTEKLNELDKHVGDGDCGDTLSRGAKQIISDLDTYDLKSLNTDSIDLTKLILQIGDTISQSMGGTSGAILEIFFRTTYVKLSEISKTKQIAPLDWCESFLAGTDSVQFYGGAKLGNRTILDSLVPALNSAKTALENQKSLNEALSLAAQAAEQGAEDTRTMRAEVGRSSYLPPALLTDYPDPGALAVAIVVRAIQKMFASEAKY